MKYKIVSDLDPIRLTENVCACIGRGYKPQGGICVVASPNGTTTFYQAMVLDV